MALYRDRVRHRERPSSRVRRPRARDAFEAPFRPAWGGRKKPPASADQPSSTEVTRTDSPCRDCPKRSK